MKVFGIGLNKTGTTTLGRVFSELGFRNLSYDLELLRSASQNDMAPIFKAINNYDSFEDWPWPLLFEEVDKNNIDSKFILTTRKNSEAWIESLKKHAERTGPTEARKIVYGYKMPHGNENEHIRMYKKHNNRVRNHFKKKGNMIEVSWEEGDGWKKICSFLGKQKPKREFPHANKSEQRVTKMIGKLKKYLVNNIFK